MERTEHIGLHQWKGTDQFLREEFNEDFRRIDGAVGGLLQSEVLVPLLRAEITEEVAAVEFDLSMANISQYDELCIRTAGLTTVQTCTVQVTFNHDREYGHYFNVSDGVTSPLGRSIALSRAPSQGRPGGWAATVCLCPDGVFAESWGLTSNTGGCWRERNFGCTAPDSPVTGRNLVTLTLEVSPYDFAGGTLYLYGLKR